MPDDLSKRDRSQDTLESCDPDGADSEEQEGEAKSCWETVKPFIGAGSMVAVGYMDPGNWATDLQAGSSYNYSILFVVLLSSLLAMFLQSMALRLGLVSGMDLASACRKKFSRYVHILLGVSAQVAICATDLAEVIGSAIAFKLLFGLPLFAGVLITGLDVLVLLAFGQNRVIIMEIIIIVMILTMAVCFSIELYYSKPDGVELLKGMFVPTADLVTDSGMLYASIGILGSIVMPHNFYLHSFLVCPREGPIQTGRSLKRSLRFATLDCNLSLIVAFLINVCILVLAASAFHRAGYRDVADLEQASSLIGNVVGERAASTLFGLALLLSGQQSTVTGTIAGQVVMEGFFDLKVHSAYIRIGTRLTAILPAVITILVAGNAMINPLLVISQVILSMQLPFALIPLVILTGDRNIMGSFVNSRLVHIAAWIISLFIVGLNFKLVVDSIMNK
ncbi:hypothetical protein GUITHDRAFT_77099 [Guillardia theta CCMP2712]|uniref:Uncharacterized protein n=2 Tax=Guillardia theta TaxID=55529 RepID=L1IR64_GUITC|nr:hypothetical protein GUITHDRAFT_77099 [Guillardia theta CCMP2712]EKX38592.1 hypothetical protein GUITHDRAFT_77099 [Guillardia theta CCMP2712]|eukprot:XP_005825572.1 hypothetical protein GUITHDRAFT_77099 [Guillardia theta CCMP2712]